MKLAAYHTRRGVSKNLLIVVGALSSLFLFGVFAVSARLREGEESKLRVCRSHLKNIGVAVEIYVQDHKEVPSSLAAAYESLGQKMPQCTDGGGRPVDSYSASYKVHPANEGQPVVYSFHCQGEHHANFAPVNFPAFRSDVGLLLAPGRPASES